MSFFLLIWDTNGQNPLQYPFLAYEFFLGGVILSKEIDEGERRGVQSKHITFDIFYNYQSA
jgi:hypothetical protein